MKRLAHSGAPQGFTYTNHTYRTHKAFGLEADIRCEALVLLLVKADMYLCGALFNARYREVIQYL